MKKVLIPIIFLCTLATTEISTQNQQRISCYEGDMSACQHIKDSIDQMKTACHDCYWPSICYTNSWDAEKIEVRNNKSYFVEILISGDQEEYLIDFHKDMNLSRLHKIKIKKIYIGSNVVNILARASYGDNLRKHRSHKLRVRYVQQCFGDWKPEWYSDDLLEEYINLQLFLKELPVKME